jgi:hypothetical protein
LKQISQQLTYRREGRSHCVHNPNASEKKFWQNGLEQETGKLSLPPASAGFLLGLLFNPEDGGGMFLWNIRLSPDNMALQPRRLYSSDDNKFVNGSIYPEY